MRLTAHIAVLGDCGRKIQGKEIRFSVKALYSGSMHSLLKSLFKFTSMDKFKSVESHIELD